MDILDSYWLEHPWHWNLALEDPNPYLSNNPLSSNRVSMTKHSIFLFLDLGHLSQSLTWSENFALWTNFPHNSQFTFFSWTLEMQNQLMVYLIWRPILEWFDCGLGRRSARARAGARARAPVASVLFCKTVSKQTLSQNVWCYERMSILPLINVSYGFEVTYWSWTFWFSTWSYTDQDWWTKTTNQDWWTKTTNQEWKTKTETEELSMQKLFQWSLKSLSPKECWSFIKKCFIVNSSVVINVARQWQVEGTCKTIWDLNIQNPRKPWVKQFLLNPKLSQ